MNLLPSHEQQALREAARSFLTKVVPEQTLGQVLDEDPGWDPMVWPQIVDLGWPGITVPDASGGFGMGQAEQIVVAEETAAALLPAPLFSTAGLALPLLVAAGHTELIRAIVTDGRAATVSWADSAGPADLGRAPATTGARVDAQGRLSGVKAWVPDLDRTDIVLALVHTDRGNALWSVPLDGRAGISWHRQAHVDCRPVFRIELEKVPGILVASAGDLPAVWAAAYPRTMLWAAAECVGICDRMLRLGVDHARTREQFGRLIGTFQAVSHRLADGYVALEMARSAVRWAAAELDSADRDASIATDCAVTVALPAAVQACETSIQVLGGTGMTWESVVHRYYKRALGLSALGGGGAAARARIADDITHDAAHAS